MDKCPSHSQQYIVYCANCETLLCQKCPATHGGLGHIIQSSEGAAQTFREKISEFHQRLQLKQESIKNRIQDIRKMGSPLEEICDPVEAFSAEILSVFERIEEIIEELKTSMITKYAQEFEYRSSLSLIHKLTKISKILQKEIIQVGSELSSTKNWIGQFDSLKAFKNRDVALFEETEQEGAVSCFHGVQSESRALSTAATVAVHLLQERLQQFTVQNDLPEKQRSRVAPADELPSSGWFLRLFLCNRCLFLYIFCNVF